MPLRGLTKSGDLQERMEKEKREKERKKERKNEPRESVLLTRHEQDEDDANSVSVSVQRRAKFF